VNLVQLVRVESRDVRRRWIEHAGFPDVRMPRVRSRSVCGWRPTRLGCILAPLR
jgi:hypothetical protein